VPERSVGEEPHAPGTQVFVDRTRSIFSHNQSPDVPFDTSLNPYRGCEHGCSYCYARPTHEYLGWSAGLDFETKLIAKPEAPTLVRRQLARSSWKPRVLALSGVTDPYQPIERQLRLTRGCLEVLAEQQHPVALITKSGLVERDLDLLSRLAAVGAVQVQLSLTTLDRELARRMEPRAAQPRARLAAIRALAAAKVPVGVSLAPLIPGLNDHEVPRILEAAADLGARWAQLLVLRLPGVVEPLFGSWLARHYPDRKKRVLSLLASMRDGKLQEARFGLRMSGTGAFFDQLRALFELSRRRYRLDAHGPELRCDAFRRPHAAAIQLSLFPGSSGNSVG